MTIDKIGEEINWYRQTDNYSCGPVAVLNAIKWAAGSTSEDERLLDWLRNVSGCGPAVGKSGSGGYPGGVTSQGLDLAIRSRTEFVVAFCKIDPSIKDIKKWMGPDKSVILCSKSFRKQSSGHAVFIPEQIGDCFKVINAGRNRLTKILLPREELRKILTRTKNSKTYRGTAWFLHRRSG
jgi:hypothetical protein